MSYRGELVAKSITLQEKLGHQRVLLELIKELYVSETNENVDIIDEFVDAVKEMVYNNEYGKPALMPDPKPRYVELRNIILEKMNKYDSLKKGK
jgi:hypothetical protein